MKGACVPIHLVGRLAPSLFRALERSIYFPPVDTSLFGLLPFWKDEV